MFAQWQKLNITCIRKHHMTYKSSLIVYYSRKLVTQFVLHFKKYISTQTRQPLHWITPCPHNIHCPNKPSTLAECQVNHHPCIIRQMSYDLVAGKSCALWAVWCINTIYHPSNMYDFSVITISFIFLSRIFTILSIKVPLTIQGTCFAGEESTLDNLIKTNMNPNIFHLVFSLFFFTIWSSNFFFYSIVSFNGQIKSQLLLICQEMMKLIVGA